MKSLVYLERERDSSKGEKRERYGKRDRDRDNATNIDSKRERKRSRFKKVKIKDERWRDCKREGWGDIDKDETIVRLGVKKNVGVEGDGEHKHNWEAMREMGSRVKGE